MRRAALLTPTVSAKERNVSGLRADMHACQVAPLDKIYVLNDGSTLTRPAAPKQFRRGGGATWRGLDAL